MRRQRVQAAQQQAAPYRGQRMQVVLRQAICRARARKAAAAAANRLRRRQNLQRLSRAGRGRLTHCLLRLTGRGCLTLRPLRWIRAGRRGHGRPRGQRRGVGSRGRRARAIST